MSDIRLPPLRMNLLFDLKILRKEAQFLDAQLKLLKSILDEC